jgi:hypothetical protein
VHTGPTNLKKLRVNKTVSNDGFWNAVNVCLHCNLCMMLCFFKVLWSWAHLASVADANADGVRFVRFEVFTAVTMKKAVFWDVAPCRYCVNRRFGGTYRLHLQGRRKKNKIRKR